MDPNKFTINLNSLIKTHCESKEFQEPDIHLLPPPNVLKSTAARDKYLQESFKVRQENQTGFKPPRTVFRQNVRVSGPNNNANEITLKQMAEPTQRILPNGNTTFVKKPNDINFFDPKQVVQGDIMEEEKKKASKLSKFGRCTARVEAPHDIEIKVKTVKFQQFSPGQIYIQKLTVVNPAKTQKKLQILPPPAPFSIGNLAVALKPGQTFDIVIYFRPNSFKPITTNFLVISEQNRHDITVVAQNESGNFVIDGVVIDGNYDKSAQIQCFGTETKQIFDSYGKVGSFETITKYQIDIGQLNKFYTRPHQISLNIKNHSDVVVKSQSKYGIDRTKKLMNQLHIKSIDIVPKCDDRKGVMNLYVAKQQCIQCQFAEQMKFQKQSDMNVENNSKYQNYIQYEEDSGIFSYYEETLSKTSLLKQQECSKQQSIVDEFEFLLLPDGVLALEIEFGDDLQISDENVIRIITAENNSCEISILGFVLEGQIEITQIGNHDIHNKIASIDMRQQNFETVYYQQKRLPEDQLIPVSTMIDIQDMQPQVIQILFKTQGISYRQIGFQLKKYQKFLALGYLSDNNTNIYQENYVQIDKQNLDSDSDNELQLHLSYNINEQVAMSIQQSNSKGNLSNLSESLSHLQIAANQKYEVQRAILDMCIQFDQDIYTVFRFVIQIQPIFPNFNALILRNQSLQLQEQINVQETPTTDYLLISEPALDLKVVPVSSGTEFTFEVKNCSQSCFIPFIVSTNIHATNTSLVSKPDNFGVRFVWNKPNEVIESELKFPDITDIMDIKRMHSINELLEKSKHGFPVDYQKIKQANQNIISARPTSRRQKDQTKQFNIPQTNLRKESQIVEPEPVVAYPQSGILPPQSSITVNVKVHPLSLGPIQGFVVINTPSTKYYETVLRKLNEKMKDVEARESATKPKPLTGSRGILNHIPNLGESLPQQRSVPLLQNIPLSTNIVIDPQIYLNPSFSKTILHQFQMFKQKMIPKSEWSRLYQQLPPQASIDGGFLSERDVTCRMYGLVAAPQLSFAKEYYHPESDQLKPLQLTLLNQGATSTSCIVQILTGDALVVPYDELPTDLSPAMMVIWEKRAKLLQFQQLQVDANSVNKLWILPGLQDSFVIVKKPAGEFGAMKQILDPNLIDSDNNVILAACQVSKRLEPIKPYVYLQQQQSAKYVVVAPSMVNMKPLYVNTRPYYPAVLEFVLVNPAAVPFNCEVSTGPDVVAPSIVKLPPQSKGLARFAINSDHSGELETFITFHDVNMRIIVNSFGPDIHIRCNYIKNSQYLVDKQGMMNVISNCKSDNGLHWDKLVNDIPTGVQIIQLENHELIDLPMSSTLDQYSVTKLQTIEPPTIVDYRQMALESNYTRIINNLPSITFPNMGGQESKYIAISIMNPTGSKMIIQPQIICFQNNMLSLIPTIDYQNQVILKPDGLFFKSSDTDTSLYFEVQDSILEIPSRKSKDLFIRSVNLQDFGSKEALLQLNGLFVRLISDRQPPNIMLGDRMEYVSLSARFGQSQKASFDLVNQSLNGVRLQLETDFPLSIDNCEPFVLGGFQQQQFYIHIIADKISQYFKMQPLSGLFYQHITTCSIDDVLNRELKDQMLSSEIRIQFIDCIVQNQLYKQSYPVLIKFIVPKVQIFRKFIQFPLTFKHQIANIQYKLENPCNLQCKWRLVHVPINDVITQQRQGRCDINLDALESASQMDANMVNNQAQYIVDVLSSIKSSFPDLTKVYYDSLLNCVVLDQPSIFEFGLSSGTIAQNQNKNPNQVELIEVRFHPTQDHIDYTKDRKYEVQYRSVYYIVVEDGQGAWFQCSGQVNQNIDMI